MTDLPPERYEAHLHAYLVALAAKDGAGVAAGLSESVVWHVGGSHPLSGRYQGRDRVLEMLAAFKERSGGTVELSPGIPMFNEDIAVVPLRFSATRLGRSMSMDGVDVFRLGPSGIEEVWLFSSDQDVEDQFWT